MVKDGLRSKLKSGICGFRAAPGGRALRKGGGPLFWKVSRAPGADRNHPKKVPA